MKDWKGDDLAMNSIRLPDQKIALSKEQNAPPNEPKWEEMMGACSDQQAIDLWQHAVRSLEQDPMWGPLVGISEQVMTDREIRFHPDPD
jgi:hypothetical protein